MSPGKLPVELDVTCSLIFEETRLFAVLLTVREGGLVEYLKNSRIPLGAVSSEGPDVNKGTVT